MKLMDTIGRLDRTQRTRGFRVAASVIVMLLGLAGWFIMENYGTQPESIRLGVLEEAAIDEFEAYEDRLRELGESIPADDPRVERYNELGQAAFRASIEAGQARLLEAEQGDGVLRVVIRDTGPMVALVVSGVALGAVGMGFGLTYLSIGFLAVAIAYPLTLFEGTREFGLIGLGAAVLIVALLTSLEGAKLILSPGTPVIAIARNVLMEAVRARIGLIFVVALIFMLALLPVVLNDTQPLRYRVQQWIQYGLGLGYLLLAVMTVFFGVATVTFEQRDKSLWMTVSKPVRSISYVFGKWLGVMVLNIVLMCTIAAGVFAFSVYMERLPADGEASYHVTLGDGAQIRPGLNTQLAPELRTKDRRLLEEEVLVARVGINPLPPNLNEDALSQAYIARVQSERESNPAFVGSEADRDRILNDLLTIALERSRTIRPGFSREFVFEGLEAQRDNANQPMLTLRYTFDAGSNDPADVYRLRFFFNGQPWPLRGMVGTEQLLEDGVQTITLGTAQLLQFPSAAIDEEGRLVVEIQSAISNQREGTFGPGGLEILYSAGGYPLNYFRSMAILLFQLGFLASVAICLSTFLSYPVAVLTSAAVFLATIMSDFLSRAVLEYATVTRDGRVLIVNLIAEWITVPVIWIFKPFAETKPIERLADGRLISWGSLSGTMIVITVVSAVLLLIGVWVFRRRELALYSGH